jgi:Carboxypeptidase regulatory-like domain
MSHIRWISLGALAASLILFGCGGPATPKGNYGSVSGTVTSDTGTPIAGADVLIDFTIDVKTGADGTYKADTVPADPGPNTSVTASAAGYSPKTQFATVAAGQNTPVNFQLTHT